MPRAFPLEFRRDVVAVGHRPGVTSAESAELREVKRRNRVLEHEVEILRRAAAYFAKDISPK